MTDKKKANKIKSLEKENTELKAKLKEGEVFIENILKASADNLNEFFELRKENEELKKLIEKMKCCENCKYHSFWGDELKCNLPSYDEQFKCLDSKDKWELID